MAQGAFFSNLTAERYAKQPVADPVSYEKKLTMTRKYFTPDTEVLEIGCGTGSTAIAHAPYVKHIDGIDYASKMVAIATEKAREAGISNTSFAVEDVDDIGNKDKRYDVVMAMNILHLLKDQASALQAIHSLLKPGGYFISSTLCAFPMPWYLSALVTIGCGLRILPPINLRSAAALKTQIEGAGFHIVEQWQHGKKVDVAFIVAQKS